MYVTGCSSLNKFYMHSNLGKVIRSLIDDFKANPPQTSPVSSSFRENMYQNFNESTQWRDELHRDELQQRIEKKIYPMKSNGQEHELKQY